MVFSRCETLVALLRFKREFLFVKSLTGMPVHSPYRQYIALGRQVGSTEQENRAILTICCIPVGVGLVYGAARLQEQKNRTLAE